MGHLDFALTLLSVMELQTFFDKTFMGHLTALDSWGMFVPSYRKLSSY